VSLAHLGLSLGPGLLCLARQGFLQPPHVLVLLALQQQALLCLLAHVHGHDTLVLLTSGIAQKEGQGSRRGQTSTHTHTTVGHVTSLTTPTVLELLLYTPMH
jgi:hypothetical protein